MERQELEDLNINQLRNLAATIPTIELQRGDSKETIVHKLLVDAATVKDTPNSQAEDRTEMNTPAKVSTTIDAVKLALNPFILRGMKLYYKPEDSTWLMRIKLKPMTMRDTNTGEIKLLERWREDSGTLNQPLETIRRCARVLMSNAPTPKQLEPERDATRDMTAVS